MQTINGVHAAFDNFTASATVASSASSLYKTAMNQVDVGKLPRHDLELPEVSNFTGLAGCICLLPIHDMPHIALHSL